mmetsp:Transcript_16078/g.44813  ORF Transcript_16078/g.44813 Transcript_16078/m.44813 type:complete len:201 (-) Transcript_16078:839-1441(-)
MRVWNYPPAVVEGKAVHRKASVSYARQDEVDRQLLSLPSAFCPLLSTIFTRFQNVFLQYERICAPAGVRQDLCWASEKVKVKPAPAFPARFLCSLGDEIDNPLLLAAGRNLGPVQLAQCQLLCLHDRLNARDLKQHLLQLLACELRLRREGGERERGRGGFSEKHPAIQEVGRKGLFMGITRRAVARGCLRNPSPPNDVH